MSQESNPLDALVVTELRALLHRMKEANDEPSNGQAFLEGSLALNRSAFPRADLSAALQRVGGRI